MSQSHPDFGIVMITVAILGGVSVLFAYCYFGSMATESYEQMADCLYNCNWLGLSNELQKYFIIMMGNTQRPIYYSGFGIAVLNLETFTKVNKLFLFVRLNFKPIDLREKFNFNQFHRC